MKSSLRKVCGALALVCVGAGLGVAQQQQPNPGQLVSRDARYLLRPGDVITVDYRYTPEYNTTASVEPDGFVSLPMLGNVKVSGMTLSQAHDALQSKAGERLNDPEINVGLKEFEKPYYVVGGEVGAPGRFELHGHVTALQAVEIAGGIKTSGKSSQVLLIRPVNGEEGETKLIDLKKVMAKRELDEDVELRPGDMLIVPKTRLAKVEPFVRLANAGFYVNPFNL